MATFPGIQSPSYPLSESFRKEQIKNQFESGYVQSRAKVTLKRESWNLVWKAMPETDYQTLRTFFGNNVGLAFDWVHPETAVNYRARFTGDSLDSQITVNKLRRVSLQLEEAPGA